MEQPYPWQTCYWKSYDIIAYMYKADLYHPECILDAMGLPTGNPEVVLAKEAIARGIDNSNEETYDSDEYPKVVFADQWTEPYPCGLCLEPIDF